MPTISSIHGREILDSRGNPTVQVKMTLSDGAIGIASVPSGASTGIHEALELRDGNKNRYGGLGVQKAVKNINEIIAPALRGLEVQQHRKLDNRMIDLDGTANKSRLGANAILGVSLAAAHAGATSLQLPLYRYIRDVFELPQREWVMPYATMNVLNGGAHAGWSIDFQECMIIPRQRKFRERVRCGSEIFHALKALLKTKGFPIAVGDEGGFAPKLKKGNTEAFSLIATAVKAAGYELGKEVGIGLDPASSEFYEPKTRKYILKSDKLKLTASQMVEYYAKLVKKYPILFLEDGCAEDDWKGWKELTQKLGAKTTLVGDDLFVTNVSRLRLGIDAHVGNGILIKVNQVGSLSETIDAIVLAQHHGYKVAVSHRSGETADTTIADLAVAVSAEFIKTGSMSRSERLEKYNRLMEIEEEVGL